MSTVLSLVYGHGEVFFGEVHNLSLSCINSEASLGGYFHESPIGEKD